MSRTLTPPTSVAPEFCRPRRTALALLVLGGVIGSAEAQYLVSSTRTVQANADSHTTSDFGPWQSSAGFSQVIASQDSTVTTSAIAAVGSAYSHWPSTNFSKSTLEIAFAVNVATPYALTGQISASVQGFGFVVPGTCSATLAGANGVIETYVVAMGGQVYGHTLDSSGTLAPGSYVLTIKGEASGFGSSPMTGADGSADFDVTLSLFGPCGAPSAGACAVAHVSPGCADVTCCEAVCAIDPPCCSTMWDSTCVAVSADACAVPPANDDCAVALPVGIGQTPVSNEQATGFFSLPASCEKGYGTSFYNDVYYRFVAEATGPVTVSTCGEATFDTRLAAFSGPCDNPTWVACNDDAVDCPGFTSSMTFNAVCGQEFTIVLGSFIDATGTATLTITQEGTCAPACSGDLDRNGSVDAADLATLLGQWSMGGGDLNGDLTTNAADLALLLGAWGPCD